MNYTKRWMILTVVAIALLATIYVGCSEEDNGVTYPPDNRDEWTILSYGAGNYHGDTIGGESMVIDHVQQMETVVGTDKVNVVAMVSSIATGGIAKYYLVEHNAGSATGDVITSTEVQDLGARNMAAVQTLKDFLSYGIITYPAKKYMVIIDGTGDGWRGACRDDVNGGEASMSAANLGQALNDVRIAQDIGSFAVISFTGASMSMTEVAYELRDAAQYLVASEYKTDLNDIFAHEDWLDSLMLAPTTDAATAAEIIVNLSFESAGLGGYHHIAAIQLSQMTNLVAKVGDLASALSTDATAYWDEVKSARSAIHPTNIYDSSYVDLGAFAEQLKLETNLQGISSVTAGADAVTTALNAAVPTSRTSISGMTNGLLVHLPELGIHFDSTSYSTLDFASPSWIAMLSGLLLGTPSRTLEIIISPSGAGTVNVSPAKTIWDIGETATLTSSAGPGLVFSHWIYDDFNYLVNPVDLEFDDIKLFEVITARFVSDTVEPVTLSGSIARTDGDLIQPILTLIDESLSFILASWLLPEGNSSADFNIQFFVDAIPGSHIYGWDNVNQDNELNGNDDYSNCYDSDDVGDTCDFITYTPGMVLDGIDITVYPGAGGSSGMQLVIPSSAIRTGRHLR